MSNCQQCHIFKLSKSQNVKIFKCQQCQIVNNVNCQQCEIVNHVKLSKCQIVKLSKCQIANEIIKSSQYQMSRIIRVCRLTQRIDCVLIFSIFIVHLTSTSELIFREPSCFFFQLNPLFILLNITIVQSCFQFLSKHHIVGKYDISHCFTR